MEDKKPNNPNAFPINKDTSVYNTGMTLRDYFANSAMQSLILKLEIDQHQLRFDSELHSIVPTLSYQIADEMLKQREL
jgi:hypothetical protein